MKSRLRQASLPAMEFALAGQQAAAQNGLGGAQAAGLYEIPIVRHQHIANEVGVINLKDRVFAETNGSHIDAAPARAGDVLERAAAKFQELTQAGHEFDVVVQSCSSTRQAIDSTYNLWPALRCRK
jgi:hypothetical protein